MFLYVKKYAVDNGTEVHGVFYQGFVAAARGSAGKVWCREPCKRRKNSASVRRQRLDFPSARMALAFSSLLLTVAVPPGPSYCRPTTRKSVFRETAVLITAPTLTARCMASRRSMESSPVKTTAF